MTWIKEILLSRYLGGWVRHFLTAAAGFLVSRNIIDADIAASLVEQVFNWLLPVAVAAVGMGSSVLEKKKRG